jgi:hypothetical protein
MAANHRNTQLTEAPQTPDSGCRGLRAARKGPTRPPGAHHRPDHHAPHSAKPTTNARADGRWKVCETASPQSRRLRAPALGYRNGLASRRAFSVASSACHRELPRGGPVRPPASGAIRSRWRTRIPRRRSRGEQSQATGIAGAGFRRISPTKDLDPTARDGAVSVGPAFVISELRPLPWRPGTGARSRWPWLRRLRASPPQLGGQRLDGPGRTSATKEVVIAGQDAGVEHHC